MNNNSWFKKEIPLQTVIGYGGGATGFGAHSSSATKTYIEDVFTVDAWIGNASTKTITNGIDLSGKGGMVWAKRRNASSYPQVFDTTRGATKQLASSDTMAEYTATDSLTAFNDNGFTLGLNGGINGSGDEIVGWTFREQKGFFDVVSFTGTGSVRTISHSLGCIPGMIMIKNVDSVNSWFTYHRELGPSSYVMLNHNNAVATGHSWFMNDTAPTATEFTLGTGGNVNESGDEFIAYVFAGGASDEPGAARSVEFDGTGDYLSLGSSSDLAMGTGDFTVEGWFKINSGSNFAFWMNGPSGSPLSSDLGVCVWYYSGASYGLTFNNGGDQPSNVHPPKGVWFHLAYVRSSGTTSLYYNGDIIKSASNSVNYTNDTWVIGGYTSTSYLMNGSVSNFRVVKGTAVYTAPFKVPTEGLTDITNTKLLCCNKNTVTGSTVTPGTITSNGDPQSSTSTPFNDPSGSFFKFGEEEDQNIITCGSFVGNSSSTNIYLGWEPQWVMIKRTSGTEGWAVFDSMRGMVSGTTDRYLEVNTSSDEQGANYIDATPTGFSAEGSPLLVNRDGDSYIYMAIRRKDPLVAKLPVAGTNAFTMDTGAGSTTIPNFDSGFLVDFAMNRAPLSNTTWYTSARLIARNYLQTNETAAYASDGNGRFDSNVGWFEAGSGTENSSYQSWMWQRGKGMDVVTYTGNGNNTDGANSHKHNLGQVPEMIWIHPLSGGSYSGVTHWTCSHKGLNGGTNPWQYTVSLNNNWEEAATSNFGNTAPTLNSFFVGDPGNGRSNDNGTLYMAMLFASANDADGNPISKLGSYVGDGTTNGTKVITLGFEPRFIIIKGVDNGVHNWDTFDSIRGFGAGVATNYLQLNNNNSQSNAGTGMVEKSTTSFTVGCNGVSGWNADGRNHIYYAHA